MATSTCPHCHATHFEMVVNEPRNANYKMLFTQCASCGSVVGVTEFYNTSARLEETKKELTNYLAHLGTIEGTMDNIETSLRAIEQKLDATRLRG